MIGFKWKCSFDLTGLKTTCFLFRLKTNSGNFCAFQAEGSAKQQQKTFKTPIVIVLKSQKMKNVSINEILVNFIFVTLIISSKNLN